MIDYLFNEPIVNFNWLSHVPAMAVVMAGCFIRRNCAVTGIKKGDQ